MTDLREILAAATPGPWKVDPHGIDDCFGDVWHGEETRVCENADAADARLIALAPQLSAALLKAREALKWYGDPETYRPHPHGLAFDSRDKSYTAAATLAEIDALMGGEK